MVARVAALLLLLPVSSVGAQQPRIPASVTREAVNVLQGTADSLSFLDSARVALVSRALLAVRRDVPQVRGIPAGEDRSFLVLFPSDSNENVFALRSGTKPMSGDDPSYWSPEVRRSRIPEIDSLNKVFGVSRMVVRSIDNETLQMLLYFRRPVHVPVVALAYRKVRVVDYAGPEIYLAGDGHFITLIPRSPIALRVRARWCRLPGL